MMKKAFCFTIDLDRDVNICIDGQLAAGSVDRGRGTSPRFDSTGKGLALLSGLLDELGVKATYFAEGRTLENIECAQYLSGHEVGMHGLDHEDLTGCNDVTLNAEMIEAILQRSSDIVTDVTGKIPRCFRAPYMKVDDLIIDMLPSTGVLYDSSMYAPIQVSSHPSRWENGIIELSVPEDEDSTGNKMSGYFWPMHEGKRSPKDYIALSEHVKEGVYTIATHTWHICESRKSGFMDETAIMNNLNKIREVLVGLMDTGFAPMTIPKAAERFCRTLD